MPPEWVPYGSLRVDAVPFVILLLFVLGWMLIHERKDA